MASTPCFLHHHVPSKAAAKAPAQRFAVAAKPSQLVCRAQKQADAAEDSHAAVSRRLALTVLVGAAAVGAKVSPADAAYGEAANVFGKPKSNTDFIPYSGEGFNLLIPAKWNPSKEVEFPGQVLRFEDNFDATSNVSVLIQNTSKKSISEYGSPEEFLGQVDYLLMKQV